MKWKSIAEMAKSYREATGDVPVIRVSQADNDAMVASVRAIQLACAAKGLSHQIVAPPPGAYHEVGDELRPGQLMVYPSGVKVATKA